MWEQIIEGVLNGSPWAIILGLCVAIVFLVKMYRKDIANNATTSEEKIKKLVTEKGELVDKLEELRDKFETKTQNLNDRIGGEKDKRLAEAVAFNNEFNSAMSKIGGSMNTLTEVIKARGAT